MPSLSEPLQRPEVFEKRVGRILETPELLAPVAPDTNAGLMKGAGENGMPGTIDLGRKTAQRPAAGGVVHARLDTRGVITA